VKRFQYELLSILSIASDTSRKEVALRATFNLFSYYEEEVSSGRVPELAVIRFVTNKVIQGRQRPLMAQSDYQSNFDRWSLTDP